MTVQMTKDVEPAMRGAGGLRVVLCGSFRRDLEGLRAAHFALSKSYEMLSPASLEFVDPAADFVRLEHEVSESTQAIEDRHLVAITHADFLWLHAPGGYVGTSAALEMGHARALGVPIFAATLPEDEVLASYVTLVDGPEEVHERLVPAPGTGLSGLQAYYGRIAARRGWSEESPTDTMLLLTEELGELARAVRVHGSLARHQTYEGSVGLEIADVQLYLVHLANTLGIDIAEAVTRKEAINQSRFDEQPDSHVA